MEKVLIITYYWPPAGGPGVQRWLKFAKYLPEFGYKPIIYTPENPDYPITDSSLNLEVPENIEVLKRKIFEPYFLAGFFSKKQTKSISSGIIAEKKNQGIIQKSLLYIRGNFFIPDARKFWIKPSVKFLKNYLLKNDIETVITTGPPHSMHLIGLALKKETTVKWVADFRDPWTNIGYHKSLKLSKKSEKKHLRLEKEVLQNADEIIATSFTTAKEFQEKAGRQINIITNGFDVEINEILPVNKKFVISHIGSLLSGRNPENLWEILGELIAENPEFSTELELKLVGKISERVVNSIKENGLGSNLRLQDYVSHPEALKIQRTAEVLLLIEINAAETRGIIPGKLFEYLAAKRPILAVGPNGWDAGKILEETKAGKFYNYSDYTALKNQLLKLYKEFKTKKPSLDSLDLEKYSRYNLTGQLAKVINKVN